MPGLGRPLLVASDSAGLAFHGLLLLVGSLAALGCVVEFSFDSLRRLPTGYMDGPIKVAAIAALIWGIAGFVVGDLIAWQLAIPALNLDLPWTSFGRLRPLHTSAVIFAFGGNVLIATSLYVVQRTCRARLPGRWAPWFVVWGYQLFLLIAGTGYLPGYYAEQRICRARMVCGPLAHRGVGRLFGHIPRYLGEAKRTAHLRGELVLPGLHRHHRHVAPRQQRGDPRQFDRSQELHRLCGRAGRHDAVVVRAQRRRLFLTAGFLGIMYYFIPKRVERPIYSYRLSIVHFWTLIFLYIWAGPHHLHYTALPDWAQTLGMTFSIMLWMPSWGGMINGLMTLSGAWDKLRTDPVVRFLVRLGGLLRHVDVRGPGDEHQGGQLAARTTPIGPSVTCTPVPSAGWRW